MPEQGNTAPCGIGLLAHVGASRREPHFYSFIPGPKTGDLSCHAEVKLYSKVKNATIYCGFVAVETAAYGGLFLEFGFVAVFSGENEVGIDENFSVACFTSWQNLADIPWRLHRVFY